jgi:hypothetical protein
MHTQHNIHIQDHKCKVNTWKHRHLVVPRIAATSGVVPRIVVDRASFEAFEEVVDEVISWVVQNLL